MVGKADMLLANRTLSALIVVCLLASGFAGLLFLADPSPANAAIGDLVVTGTYTIENIVQPVDGNVIIETGGNLIISDATLSVISNQDPAQRHSISVNSGGILTLDHGTITTYVDQIDPWPFLTINVNGGTLKASGASMLQFPGSIVLTADAHVTLNDTTVTSLSDDLVNEFVVKSSGGLLKDQADDGPAITVTSSTLNLFDSSIMKIPEYSVALMPGANLTLSGSANMLAVNSYIGVDFGPVNVASDWYTHNVVLLTGTARAYLYGCSFETYTGINADRVPAIVTSLSAGTGFAASKGAADNTGEDVSTLASLDGLYYQVNPGETMEIDTWSATYLDGLPVTSAAIAVTYTVNPGYNGNGAIQWAPQGGTYKSTTIVPKVTDPPGTAATYGLPLGSIRTVGDVKNLNLRFIPGGSVGSVLFDRAWITFNTGSSAFIYRWLNATVGDEYGVPIGPPDYSASISAKFTGDTELEGQDAFYYSPSGVSTTPPTEVLDYMGETAGTYKQTKADGRTVIPYLTDMILDGMASSLFVGSYAFTGSSNIGGTPYSSTSAFSLGAYPAMEPGDQSSDFTVKLPGASVKSPIPARWLVVPPSLLIEDMTYYHAGDVIVAAGGTLTFKNSVFQLVQESSNQRSVVVDGTLALPARLEFKNTLVTSDKLINFIVQGDGVLEAWDSVFQGVNIIALENSQVIFHNVSMNGNISTAWNSNAHINIYDSDLMQTITLSGNAVGGFTNTSVPSVRVENDAVANIYRWIHVTVIDGAGYPCPDADVTVSYFINGTQAATGVSDNTGVAKVRSTATVITATGSTFEGNYKVNTSLHVHGDYWAPSNVSVGVMPYTEPLGKNATYVVMTLPKAFPDLMVNPTTSLSIVPDDPMNHNITTVSATVYNVGAVPAHGVSAQFWDETVDGNELIGSGTVDYIPVDGSGVISIQWEAHGRLTPYTHNISVVVDPDNTIPELDETPQVAWKVIQIQSLPDVEVRAGSEIWTSPSDVIVNTTVSLVANIHNVGDATTGDVQVDFYDVRSVSGTILIGTATPSGITQDHAVEATVTWTPTTTTTQETHTILVRANGGISGTHLFIEISYANNEASKMFTVLSPPDLRVSNLQFSPTGAIPGGDRLTITATLRNSEVAPVYFTTVALYLGAYPDTAVEVDEYDVTDRLADNSATTIMFSYVTPVVTTPTNLTFSVVANPTGTTPIEVTLDNNFKSGYITVLDMRPDLVVTPSSITVKTGTETKTSSTFGRTVTVEVNVTNSGGRPAYNFTVQVGLRNLSFDGGGSSNYTLYEEEHNISAAPLNHVLTISFQWTIELTVWANYQLYAFADSQGNVSEPIKSDNFAYIPFEIMRLQADVQIIVEKTEFKAGDDVFITATITYLGTANEAVPNVPLVFFRLVDSTTQVPVPGSDTKASNASATGMVIQTLTIPQTIKSGSYDVVAVFLSESHTSTSAATLQISSQVSGGLFPWWVWVLIIVVVGAAIAGFTLYTYFYGLGKYVECGECGAFIPAASKRCPKCGVEFEAGTMKCSECGAWIPAESTECPNCGVKFVGEVEEDADYLERMRKEYDEMVSKYRELARPELGKKFSDKAFDEWWRRQPGYISFDDWLAKEEEKKKEGPVPCPVCGTLNPKEATVCHKCGTVFGVTKGAPPTEKKGPPPAAPPVERPVEGTTTEAAVPGAAPRMVIRRPIEKKVVPKKIIRTPTGQVVEEEPKEGENNQ